MFHSSLWAQLPCKVGVMRPSPLPPDLESVALDNCAVTSPSVLSGPGLALFLPHPDTQILRPHRV